MDLSLQPWLKKICPTCSQVDFSESCSLDVKMRGGEPRILLIFHLDLSFLDFINHEYNKHITTSSFQALSLGYFQVLRKWACTMVITTLFQVSNRKTSWLTLTQSDLLSPFHKSSFHCLYLRTQSHCNLYCDGLYHHWRLETCLEEGPVSPSLGSRLYVKWNLGPAEDSANEWMNKWMNRWSHNLPVHNLKYLGTGFWNPRNISYQKFQFKLIGLKCLSA